MKLILGTTLLACLLGIAVDLVTANVAVEYFSVHHPRIIASDHPILLALAWGVAVSWWFGAIAGAVLLLLRRRLSRPPSDGWILQRSALACSAVWVAMMATVVGIYAISALIPPEQRRPTFESDRRLMAVALAHGSEYVLGAVALGYVAVAARRFGRN